ncbi:serine protease [Actinoplanes sp. NEAU-A12]|uniref:Serine protease n=1 Tax=Actinoplanes sandaracinus TaxID=3045177 RepID=A0ABT6WGF8_9ACTN|nr:serine protease [Actinoplanes sandaracinus]MDI6098813.1 serine protease [Actinoplanes sandaracinus]
MLHPSHGPVGTCFQVAEGYLVTAEHVLRQISADQVDSEVWIEPMSSPTAPPLRAIVLATDPKNDLALLRSNDDLPASVPSLAYSDPQRSGTEFTLAGYGIVPEADGEEARFRFLQTQGKWQGSANRIDGSEVAIATASGAVQGMSGCPAIRDYDQTVIGVLSGRYTSEDGWNQHRIWVTRVEAVEALISPYVKVPTDRSGGTDSATRESWLDESPIDRQRVLEDVCYVGDDWTEEWQKASNALKESSVLIVVTTGGAGATTFAERLLAENTPTSTRLTHVDPGDWDEPDAKLIPRRAKYGAVLDLRDPEHDRPTEAFLRGISKLATWNKNMESYLVITVRDELWPGFAAKAIDGFLTVYLRRSPDPLKVAKRYISARAPRILSALDEEVVVEHLRRRNAVQTMTAVERILRLFEISVQNGNTAILPTALEIADAIDEHLDELDIMFGERSSANGALNAPPHPSDKTSFLNPEDRCLLIALACQPHVHLSKLESNSDLLEKRLRGSGFQAREDGAAFSALTKPGLRGRLKSIKAVRSPGDVVSLKREGLAESVIAYVWENYPKVRHPITAWLIESAAEDSEREKAVGNLLATVVQSRQDVDFLKNEIASQTRKNNRPKILQEVLTRALEDSHMRRRCERLLYDWAVQSDFQGIVVKVATKMLYGPRKDIALKRLQRVADHTTSDTLQSTIVEVFRTLADDPSSSDWYLDKISSWFTKSPDSRASGLAFMAILQSETRGFRWLISEEAQSDKVDRMLGRLIADPSLNEAIVRMVHHASLDGAMYPYVIERIGRAVRESGTFMLLIDLSARLREAGREGGRDPIADLGNLLRFQ